jgi:hypothetical protein
MKNTIINKVHGENLNFKSHTSAGKEIPRCLCNIKNQYPL